MPHWQSEIPAVRSALPRELPEENCRDGSGVLASRIGAPVTLHMFSDESKARGYITGAVVVPAGSVARVRATCREWAMPGSRRFHAQKESTARRRLALASLISMERDVRIVLVESAQGQLEREARQSHLAALATWASDAGVSRWVIERDQTVEVEDRRTLSSAHSGVVTSSLEYVHLRAAHDAVLWAADLAAWGWKRGGEYRAGIEPLVVTRIRV